MSHFRRLARAFSLSTLFAALALPTWAQGAPAASPAATPLTLASALAAAIPPTEGVAFAVDAAKVKLPKDVALPGVQSTVVETASLFGQIARDYGDVTAIAPATMTVVYAPPDTPNPYDGMPPGQVLKLLTASFDAQQWKTFMGPGGIALPDLTSDSQKQLFMAFFADGHLKIIKDNPTGRNDPKTTRDISGDALAQARIKLAYTIKIGMPEAGKPDTHRFGPDFRPADAPGSYIMTNDQGSDVDREFGATARATVPNIPKPSDLKPSPATDKVQVTLGGVKTIDGLVARIAAAIHLEIYADPRYGKRIITLLGPTKTASASDLLQALALCVHGTYRQIGPAYVLTDDLIGAGVKHVLRKHFEAKADAMLPNLYSAPQSNPAGYTMRDIDWGSDPLAFSSDQQDRYWNKQPGVSYGSEVLYLTLPFDHLTPVQQAIATKTYEVERKDDPNASLDGTFTIQAQAVIQVALPAVDAPVIVWGAFGGILPASPLGVKQTAEQRQPVLAAMPRIIPSAKPVSTADIKASLSRFSHRAARISVTSDDDISPEFAALQKLGFNEAWLDIPVSVDAKGDLAPIAPVAKAAQVGKKTGVIVCPAMRLLDWGKDAPYDLLDRDIEGRTPTEANKLQRTLVISQYDTVTPLAPEVVKRLTTLVSEVAGVKGIGGMVWDDLDPQGYQPFTPDGPDMSFEEDPLGYAVAGRLANLREYHVDPIDIYSNSSTDERADVKVPGFNDDFQEESTLYENWRRLRAHAAQGMAHWLIAALPQSFLANSPDRLSLIVQPSNGFSFAPYGSWDDLMQPQPTESFDYPKDADGQRVTGVPGTEGMSSKQQYASVQVFANSKSAAAWAVAAANALVRAAPTPGHGVVLNATPEELEALGKLGN